MKLVNKLSAEQRSKMIDQSGQNRVTLSFYKYYSVEDPQKFRDELFESWEKLDALGRIYIAKEGINAQMSVPENTFQQWKVHLESYPPLKGLRLNIAVEQNAKSFLKLTVKVRHKIVADGIENPDFNAADVGVHLKAREFNQKIDQPGTMLVDMRNFYESEIGHFHGAILPDVDTFRASLDIIEEDLRDNKDSRQLVMYCTGGIRCEKASAYFKYKGFKNVFQLEGGIIEYLRQVKAEKLENKFRGKNFVFDERMAERISDDVVSNCHLCGASCDTHHNCNNEACHILFIQCSACAEKLDGCCSENCLNIWKLPDPERKKLRQGMRRSKKYFKRQRL